jgi:hypothetical protein
VNEKHQVAGDAAVTRTGRIEHECSGASEDTALRPIIDTTLGRKTRRSTPGGGLRKRTSIIITSNLAFAE